MLVEGLIHVQKLQPRLKNLWPSLEHSDNWYVTLLLLGTIWPTHNKCGYVELS